MCYFDPAPGGGEGASARPRRGATPQKAHELLHGGSRCAKNGPCPSYPRGRLSQKRTLPRHVGVWLSFPRNLNMGKGASAGSMDIPSRGGYTSPRGGQLPVRAGINTPNGAGCCWLDLVSPDLFVVERRAPFSTRNIANLGLRRCLVLYPIARAHPQLPGRRNSQAPPCSQPRCRPSRRRPSTSSAWA